MRIYILNNRIYVKNEFDDIRDARQAKRIEKIECECGSKISKWNESHHRKTKKHLLYIDVLTKNSIINNKNSLLIHDNKNN